MLTVYWQITDACSFILTDQSIALGGITIIHKINLYNDNS